MTNSAYGKLGPYTTYFRPLPNFDHQTSSVLKIFVFAFSASSVGEALHVAYRVGRQGTLLCKEINIGYL